MRGIGKMCVWTCVLYTVHCSVVAVHKTVYIKGCVGSRAILMWNGQHVIYWRFNGIMSTSCSLTSETFDSHVKNAQTFRI